ncbi:MarR family transcriptional regulator [Variovorax sp. J22G21]|uniref:MarR family winged helix-turn-helix transcriptional regulator n=1 Tax=Variovorax fucosicus TaxID=3053517 RepID=UPI002576AC56|nr:MULTISPECIES: MarR family transcriptional regulator [unclassified Variovorax]MDM0042284.1 MarR family transcriptional regulator [Variovorax sp. J22R193]MDM0059445.1 MarR family transcriptional regulator [Variovorax sp. J22G47]MDM0060888.1 MarR family transcriptional regulator [Variovorax sp. J22G21]
MTDSNARPPSRRSAEDAKSVPDFYQAENYRAEESVGYMMRRILAAVSQQVELQMLCEPGSPTYPQWIPLHKLQMGTATTVAELARECLLDTGAMTRLLDRLEAKGLCRRVRSLADRRVVNIELTDEGRTAAEQVPHLLCRVQNEHLAGFSREEWEQFKSYLHRILDNAQALQARGEKNDASSS